MSLVLTECQVRPFRGLLSAVCREKCKGLSVWDPGQIKVKATKGGSEPELISWDEVEAQKDVYEAITTADGRQALVKAAAGVHTALSRTNRCILSSNLQVHKARRLSLEHPTCSMSTCAAVGKSDNGCCCILSCAMGIEVGKEWSNVKRMLLAGKVM